MEWNNLPDDILKCIEGFIHYEMTHTLYYYKKLLDIESKLNKRTNEEWLEHWNKQPFYMPRLIKICSKTVKYQTYYNDKILTMKKEDVRDWIIDNCIYNKKNLNLVKYSLIKTQSNRRRTKVLMDYK